MRLIVSIIRFSINGENVIIPKDPSITKAGGEEMTETDKKRLNIAYGRSHFCYGNMFILTIFEDVIPAVVTIPRQRVTSR